MYWEDSRVVNLAGRLSSVELLNWVEGASPHPSPVSAVAGTVTGRSFPRDPELASTWTLEMMSMQDSRQPMLAIRISHVIAACQNKHGDANCRDRKIDIKTLAED